MPSWLSLGFQDSCSIIMSELSYFHDYVMTIMLSVLVLISYVIFYILFNSKFYKFFSEGTFIETVWSVVPAFVLIILVLPSMKVLYMTEEVKSPLFSVKVVAHQWYWTYVVPFFNNYSISFNNSFLNSYEFDSLHDLSDLSSPRLLGSSSDLFLPVGISSRLLVTSTDVIHSFSLPSLGLKVDALPGRINQIFASPNRLGYFYGQCSEICGSSHSFMPISVKVSSLFDFDSVSKSYLLESLEDLGVNSIIF